MNEPNGAFYKHMKIWGFCNLDEIICKIREPSHGSKACRKTKQRERDEVVLAWPMQIINAMYSYCENNIKSHGIIPCIPKRWNKAKQKGLGLDPPNQHELGKLK